jgi:hypothetical protein
MRIHIGNTVVVLSLCGSVIGCGGGTPTSPTQSDGSLVPAPTLVSPTNGGYVQQNDPATNCRYDPVYGYGVTVTFMWTAPVVASGIESYDIEFKHPDASVPVFTQRVQTTKYLYIGCGFVAGSTQGWQWRVRARTSDGREGKWSDPYYLNFTDCRLANGLRCAEQPPR